MTSAVTPAFFSTASCASMHMPQPFIADTARLNSSKSILSMPGAPITFMRSLAGMLRYSWFPARCVKR